MKYSLLTISLLLAYAKAKDTRYCWSEKLGFEWYIKIYNIKIK